MSLLHTILKTFVGDKNERDLKHYSKILGNIKLKEEEISKLSLEELRAKTQEFKQKIKSSTKDISSKIEEIKAQIEQTKDVLERDELYQQIDQLNKEAYKLEERVLKEILPEAFAVLKETARRFKENEQLVVTATSFDRELSATKPYVTIEGDKAIWKNSWDANGKPIVWDMVHYDVQLIGGAVLHDGKIAEMATGEGKTLVATLPIYLNALTGRGVHVVTVNDYLAKRDAAWNAPLFEFHGLSVDCIDHHQPHSEGRKKAYRCDITYGTNNEFGFDYLRDNMATSMDELVQRELNYAIVDEVDSVLIDDARTPLIISGPVPKGDRHEFDVLKPKVEALVNAQKQELNKTLIEAKKLIAEGDKKEGGFKLLQVYRGLPKHKPLIKFLSEEGIKTLLQKTENYYMQDNNREMHKVDKHLYFVIDEKNNSIELTDKGVEFLSQGMEDKTLFVLEDLGTELAEIEKLNLPKEEEMRRKEELYRNFSIKSERIHSLNQLLKAYTLFEKDVEYVVMDGQVKIVDEQTGRIMEGRRYSDGLHQAIEAKENVKIEAATQTFATITLQNFFRMYNKLAGMTGTAQTEAGEFWEIYKLDVVVIPTNKPIARIDYNDKIYKTNREKFNAVIDEIVHLSQVENRPVLVGTTSVEVSEFLSRSLSMRKIKHNVLNAKLHKKEAEIVAEAGRSGVVTIATNMAGRGTDIKLTDEARNAGGLAIIGTERHDSRRVDRQLRGRAGRQGDPGTSQFYVSLEDPLMRLFGSERLARIMDRLGHKEGDVIQHSIISKSIERAQKKVEENNFGIRKRLLEYDDVMNKQREVIYRRRRNALSGERLALDIANMIYDTISSIVQSNKAANDYSNFEFEMVKYFAIQSPITKEEFSKSDITTITEKVFKQAEEFYRHKLKETAERVYPLIEDVYLNQGHQYRNIQIIFTDGLKSLAIITSLKNAFESRGESLMKDFEKGISLALIDEYWKIHLREMDELRRSVQAASYEQKDPLVIYKQESFHLFSEMLDTINKEVVSFLFKGELEKETDRWIQQVQNKPKQKVVEGRGYDTNANSGSENSQPKQPVRSIKINRNDIVKIIHTQSGEQKELKYKQAEHLISSGEWVLAEMK